MALENVALAQDATTDDLTGLLNRRGFFVEAEAELARRRRDGEDSLVLYADLNGLKTINDEGGHEAGDTAIARAAGVLSSELGPEAVVGRIGGDEFAALVPATRRIALGALPGLSVGIVESPGADRRSIDELLLRADEGMYRQKRGGAEAPRVRKAPREG